MRTADEASSGQFEFVLQPQLAQRGLHFLNRLFGHATLWRNLYGHRQAKALGRGES